MNTLSQLQNQLDAIRVEQSKIASRLSDVAAERFELETDATDLAATIETADVAVVAALAAHELGEPSDVAGAQKDLSEARLLAQNSIEPTQRLRVLDTLKARFDAEHVALHEKGLVIMAAIREAEKDRLIEVANELFNDCETALESLAQAEPKLLAVRTLLGEYGHPWHLGQLVQAQVQARFPTTPNAARSSVLAELNA